MEHKFERTHKLYTIEGAANAKPCIDGKHNVECLDKLIQSVDKVLDNISRRHEGKEGS